MNLQIKVQIQNLQKWITLYHISARMRYNKNGYDNSEQLLQEGIEPHRGHSIKGQENGFFVWPSSHQAMVHADFFAQGPRSLVTVKVRADSFCFPDWKFDGDAYNSFLFDGLCAQHADAAQKVFDSEDFRQEMEPILGKHRLVLHRKATEPLFVFFNQKNDVVKAVSLYSRLADDFMQKLAQALPEFKQHALRLNREFSIKNNLSIPEEELNNVYCWTCFLHDDFRHELFSPFMRDIGALKDNVSFMAEVKKDIFYQECTATYYQVNLNTYKTVVCLQTDNGIEALHLNDKEYEQVFNAVVCRIPAMQESYDGLLRRNSATKGKGFMVGDVFYENLRVAPCSIKYTGDKPLPVFSVTALEEKSSDGCKLRAKGRPKFNSAAFQRLMKMIQRLENEHS